MPVVESFSASKGTRQEMITALDGLNEERQNLIIGAVASLCTEVQLHERKRAMEQFRQEWSENLRVMLGMMK